jgi:hypothetical protein
MVLLEPTIDQLIDQHYERNQDAGFRPHLGGSVIGRPCAREIWYGFRWMWPKYWTGRMLRLFERGQNEEERFVKYLREIGLTVHDVDPVTGKQFRVALYGGHFGGSLDGCVYNVPAPGTPKWHVLELKTHNRASFDKLLKVGVMDAKPEHFSQMQIYMLMTDMSRALYGAVCKDDDRLYFERVRFDAGVAAGLLTRAETIIFGGDKTMPGRISDDPDNEMCKWCDYRNVCHFNLQPVMNCRTCRFSKPTANGEWHCNNDAGCFSIGAINNTLTVEMQKKGCQGYEQIEYSSGPSQIKAC